MAIGSKLSLSCHINVSILHPTIYFNFWTSKRKEIRSDLKDQQVQYKDQSIKEDQSMNKGSIIKTQKVPSVQLTNVTVERIQTDHLYIHTCS